MNKAKQLNIRIKFPPQTPEAVTEETGYIYHWHRIIGATLLTITILSTLVYGVSNYLNQQNMSERYTEIKTIHPSPVKEDTTQKQHENKATPITNDEESSISLTANKTTAPEKSEQIKKRTASPFTQSKVEIFSKHIKRFVITEAVKKREPVGSINNIDFDSNNLATVYAYSHAVGLKNETLYYKWRLNDKDIAQIKITVAANRWRSYSRKFIQPHMHGQWSVSLEDKKGKILAISQFSY